jgi:predicted extracellular nuclease
MTSKPQNLPIQTSVGGDKMADTMFGDGITVIKATYTGDALSGGIFSAGQTTSPGVVPADEGVILSTGHVTDFTNATGAYNQTGNRSTDTKGIDGDAALNAIAGVKTFDGAFVTTQFTSTGDELTMQLVFASEEYLEWVKSGDNDAVGIWVNGVQAQLELGVVSREWWKISGDVLRAV